MKACTADQYQDQKWAEIEADSKWRTPEPDVMRRTGGLTAGARILDLGAGVGRHALWLTGQGFDAMALDTSPEGLAEIDKAGGAETKEARMDALPLDSGSFDHVLSWNVICHGNEDVLLTTLGEIRRVLKPGGTFLAMMLSKRRLPHERGKVEGREIARNVCVLDPPGTDKVHPIIFAMIPSFWRCSPGLKSCPSMTWCTRSRIPGTGTSRWSACNP